MACIVPHVSCTLASIEIYFKSLYALIDSNEQFAVSIGSLWLFGKFYYSMCMTALLSRDMLTQNAIAICMVCCILHVSEAIQL